MYRYFRQYDCCHHNRANISGDIISSAIAVGGILGDQNGSSLTTTISNVTVSGAISSGNAGAGGIAGLVIATGTNIDGVFSNIDVQAQIDDAGGIVGRSSLQVILNDCYAIGAIANVTDCFVDTDVNASTAGNGENSRILGQCVGCAAPTNARYTTGNICNNPGGGGCLDDTSTVETVANLQVDTTVPLTNWAFPGTWQENAGAFPTLVNVPQP